MDQMERKPGNPDLMDKPFVGFVVILFVALFVGGWLYVDSVRGEMEMRIGTLSSEIDALKARQTAKAPASPPSAYGPLVLPTLPQGTSIGFQALTGSSLESIYQYAESCGAKFADGYLQSRESKVAGRGSYHYEFNLSGPGISEISPKYTLSLLPNPGYADLAAVQKDFVACDAGGEYPVSVNGDWIVMGGSCGGMGDENGLPLGCETIRSAFADTYVFR